MITKIRKIPLLLIVTTILIIIFLILAYKNPFADRSTLANLEPYPDTLYYGYPAWSLAHGHGFAMQFENVATKIIVPPAYSLYLTPFFLLVNDVRVFYFANILLAIGTILILIKVMRDILGKSLTSTVVTATCGFLYVTSFYIFTLPMLLMAENITLFFVAVGLYLLVAPITKHTFARMGIIMAIMILIKFSNFPFALGFGLLYLVKAFKKSKRDALRLLAWLAGGIFVVVLYIVVSKILVGHKNLNGSETIATRFFLTNLTHYIAVIFGTQTAFLWYTERLMSPLVALFATGGLIVGVGYPKWRQISCAVLLLIVTTLVSMSFFAKVDGRYFIALLPAVIILVAIFLVTLLNIAEKRWGKLSLLLIIPILAVYLGYRGVSYAMGESTLISLKQQIGLNFIYKADPWNYHAVQNLNAYFRKRGEKQAYIGTVLPPFYVAFFANGNYHHVPLTLGQEFYGGNKPYVEGIMKSETISDYYTRLITSGNEVYVTNAYLGNVSGWGVEFESLRTQFEFKLVKEGCFGSCNIYRVEKKI